MEYATGEPENPVPQAALVDKFVSLVGNLLPPDWARDLADRILRLDEQASLSDVLGSLRG